MYKEHILPVEEAVSGIEAAALLGVDEKYVYKTLVTVAKSLEHYVFVIPVAAELDLKKAAKVVGEKSVEMLKSKDLLALTGYVHGGCSPVGMKNSSNNDRRERKRRRSHIFSGGKIGYQIETTLKELEKAIRFTLADVTVNN